MKLTAADVKLIHNVVPDDGLLVDRLLKKHKAQCELYEKAGRALLKWLSNELISMEDALKEYENNKDKGTAIPDLRYEYETVMSSKWKYDNPGIGERRICMKLTMESIPVTATAIYDTLDHYDNEEDKLHAEKGFHFGSMFVDVDNKEWYRQGDQLDNDVVFALSEAQEIIVLSYFRTLHKIESIIN